MDDEELISDMSQDFIDEIPQMLQEMEQIFSAAQEEEASRYAHTLNGASGNFSALALAKTAREMEVYCQKGNFDAALALVAVAKEQLEDIRQILIENGYLDAD